MLDKAPQVMKMLCPQTLQGSENHEQKVEEDQFDGAHSLPQGWASPSTHKG